MRTKPGSSVPLSLSGLPSALGEPSPSPPPGPSLAQPQVGSPQPVPQDPKLLAPGGAPRGQSKAMASAHCKGRLHPVLPWLLRTGQTGEPAPASWEKDNGWPGRGQQVRGALWSGCPGKASQQGGAEQRCAQREGLPCQQPCRRRPSTKVEGGGLEREAGPLGPRAGLRCAHSALHAGELGGLLPPCAMYPTPCPQEGLEAAALPTKGGT